MKLTMYGVAFMVIVMFALPFVYEKKHLLGNLSYFLFCTSIIISQSLIIYFVISRSIYPIWRKKNDA
jgi:hypothetical protein